VRDLSTFGPCAAVQDAWADASKTRARGKARSDGQGINVDEAQQIRGQLQIQSIRRSYAFFKGPAC